MKIKTEKLQKLLNKAAKCVGNNKLLPLTSLVLLNAKGGKITAVTTDNINYLYTTEVDADGDIYVVTEFGNLYKLVSKLTSEYIELNVDKNTLKIVSNGKYTLPVVLDDSGEMLKYPDPVKKFKSKADEVISTDVINKITKNIKSAVATTLDVPYLANYYVGDLAIASDTLIATKLSEKILKDPKLFSVKLLSLVELTEDTDVKFGHNEESVLFTANDLSVYSTITSKVEDFPIDVINGLFDEKLQNTVELNNGELSAVVDRAALFTDSLLTVKFGKDSAEVSTDGGDFNEKLKYSSGSGEKFTCKVDINLLKTQLSGIAEDVIAVSYGSDKIIKFDFDNISKIIALGE